MLIYLAARYSRLEELDRYASDLRNMGHRVDARWLLGNHQIGTAKDVEAAIESVPMEGQPFALDDLEDLFRADMLIAFSETPRSGLTNRGGRHVEFGAALAWDKQIIVVGPRENVFHTLPQVRHFWLWMEALTALAQDRLRPGARDGEGGAAQ